MSAYFVQTSGGRTINYKISLIQGQIIPISEIEGGNASWAKKWGMKRLLHSKIKFNSIYLFVFARITKNYKINYCQIKKKIQMFNLCLL